MPRSRPRSRSCTSGKPRKFIPPLPTLPIGFIASQSAWQPGVYRVINSTEPARLFRNTIVSTCAAEKQCPGEFPSGPVAYSAFVFLNPFPNRNTCITVTVRSFNDLLAPVMSHAHYKRYNPDDVCARYVGDLGTNGSLRSYQFNLVKGVKKFVIVIENVNSNANFGSGNFTLSASTTPVTVSLPNGGSSGGADVLPSPIAPSLPAVPPTVSVSPS